MANPKKTLVAAALVLCFSTPASAWVGISPSGDVTIRDHTEVRPPRQRPCAIFRRAAHLTHDSVSASWQIGYWDSTESAKDLRVTGSEYVRGNVTLTNGAIQRRRAALRCWLPAAGAVPWRQL
jgi:hypothetical protein